ncbi:MAG TPA: hypothetical protein VNI84_18955 [Pyrinomonadaceae bacterium]|nr:hypothetical protein [Pyrinomonadaceae bacterium]
MRPKQQKIANHPKETDATITVTVDKLFRSLQSLNQLFNQTFKPQLAFKLSKLAKQINNIVADCEKQRNALYKENGTLDLDSNTFKFEPDKEKIVDEAMKAVAEREVVLNGIQIRVEELGSAAFAPAVLLELDWLIVG